MLKTSYNTLPRMLIGSHRSAYCLLFRHCKKLCHLSIDYVETESTGGGGVGVNSAQIFYLF